MHSPSLRCIAWRARCRLDDQFLEHAQGEGLTLPAAACAASPRVSTHASRPSWLREVGPASASRGLAARPADRWPGSRRRNDAAALRVDDMRLRRMLRTTGVHSSASPRAIAQRPRAVIIFCRVQRVLILAQPAPPRKPAGCVGRSRPERIRASRFAQASGSRPESGTCLGLSLAARLAGTGARRRRTRAAGASSGLGSGRAEVNARDGAG